MPEGVGVAGLGEGKDKVGLSTQQRYLNQTWGVIFGQDGSSGMSGSGAKAGLSKNSLLNVRFGDSTHRLHTSFLIH